MKKMHLVIDGLAQDCSNPIVIALELLQSCINLLSPRYVVGKMSSISLI